MAHGMTKRDRIKLCPECGKHFITHRKTQDLCYSCLREQIAHGGPPPSWWRQWS